MRKIAIFATVALVLSVAATAYAAQVNTYTVDGSTSPKTSGSKKKPKPIGIKFNFAVSEASGQRPAVVERYVIKFAGTRVNTSVAPACRRSQLDKPGGPKNCPSRSIVGTGFIVNETGNPNDPNDKSIKCNAGLSVVNLGKGKASIYVQGGPNETDERRKCLIDLNAGIPATFRNSSTGSTLTFVVPDSLKHPGGLSNAVKSVESTIKRITKKGRGFYEATGCKAGKRDVTVTFRTEDGRVDNVTEQANCK